MSNINRYPKILILIASLAGQKLLFAQTPAMVLQFEQANKMRAELVAKIVKAELKPEVVLVQLEKTFSGPQISSENKQGLAFATVDVGQRLLSVGKPAEAELFFKEAERLYANLAKHTPDSESETKASYLEMLSKIRDNFLGQHLQAKTDLDAAIALRPADGHLKSSREVLMRRNSELFRQTDDNIRKSKDETHTNH